MRPILLTATFLTFFGLGACADHGGSMVGLDSPPPSAPPISPPDDRTVVANPGDPGSGTQPGNNNGATGGAGSGSNNGGDGGSPVPEPGTMLLVGTGLAGAALLRRRRQIKVESQ